MAKPKRSVLITGCSDGCTGAALAEECHRTGFNVYATARKMNKTHHLAAPGVETLELNILSDSSISECVRRFGSPDILVSNAGAQYPVRFFRTGLPSETLLMIHINLQMPILDLSTLKAKELFDINASHTVQR